MPCNMQIYLSLLIDSLFIVAICSVVLASSIQRLSSLLKYGKTLSKVTPSSNMGDKLMHIYVPKRWFTHFYMLSFTLSLLFLVLISSHHDQTVVAWSSKFSEYVHFANYAISKEQCYILLLLNYTQAIRRSYECLYVSKFGADSRINLSHYLVGIFFYSSVNVLPLLYYLQGVADKTYEFTETKSSIVQLLVCLIVFTYASYQQNIHHVYLSTLKKYNRPQEHWFKYSSCPHYFFEILIYSSHIMISFNSSTTLALIWVAVNLGVSANEIYNYYIENSKETINKAVYWRMIPFVY